MLAVLLEYFYLMIFFLNYFLMKDDKFVESVANDLPDLAADDTEIGIEFVSGLVYLYSQLADLFLD